jgi:hypothetical protein
MSIDIEIYLNTNVDKSLCVEISKETQKTITRLLESFQREKQKILKSKRPKADLQKCFKLLLEAHETKSAVHQDILLKESGYPKLPPLIQMIKKHIIRYYGETWELKRFKKGKENHYYIKFRLS